MYIVSMYRLVKLRVLFTIKDLILWEILIGELRWYLRWPRTPLVSSCRISRTHTSSHLGYCFTKDCTCVSRQLIYWSTTPAQKWRKQNLRHTSVRVVVLSRPWYGLEINLTTALGPWNIHTNVIDQKPLTSDLITKHTRRQQSSLFHLQTVTPAAAPYTP